MTAYELRTRDWDEADDGKLALFQPREGASLADVCVMADRMDGHIDIYADGAYLVTSGWYWWPRAGDDAQMHQIGSHGWCHDCHRDDLGYVHHLAYDAEVAVLTAEAREDRVLAQQCRADGITAAQYAAEVAGRAVPADGDSSFAIDVHELGVNADGLAEFAVDMWDMTTWKVAVEVAPGAPLAAQELAEERAYHAGPRRCFSCKGREGRHAPECSTARLDRLDALDALAELDSSQADT